MPAPTATVTTRPLPGADAEVMSTLYPVPGLGLVPINLFLLRAGEPVLVDTGPLYLREQVLAAVEALIDLDDLRWIYLTHTDPDHVGCLRDVLARAPRARVVTTFVGYGKLGVYEAIPPERVYLLNPGQRLSVGDRELEAVEPVTFDAPETTGFVDRKTGALFSSDSFGGVLAGPADLAGDVPASTLREGIGLWASIDSPWLRHVEASALEAALARVRALAPPVVLSSHLPPAYGLLDLLVEAVASARERPRFVGPDQAGLTALLASLAAQETAQQPALVDGERAPTRA